MENEWKVREEICHIGRLLHERGYVAANDGNISVRIGKGRYLCTPTGVAKGFMKPADLALVDDAGKQLSGPKPRTSEILLHLEIYQALPGINAVVHAHPPHATAFAVAGVSVPNAVLPEVEIFIGEVPIAQYDTPGSKTFAQTILPHLRNKANTILLANHGAVACDKSLEQAYFHLETLDHYCRILLLARDLGRVQQLSPDKMRDLLAIKKRMGIDDSRFGHESDAAVLIGSDEFLRGFSRRAIAQHQSDPNGAGRGQGIAGAPSQAGQPQPAPPRGVAAGGISRPVRPAGMGSSSRTARQRTFDDEVERLTQVITDQIVESFSKA